MIKVLNYPHTILLLKMNLMVSRSIFCVVKGWSIECFSLIFLFDDLLSSLSTFKDRNARKHRLGSNCKNKNFEDQIKFFR